MAERNQMKLTAKKNFFVELRSSYADFTEAFARFQLALNLAIQDTMARYRGSILGPWWITITSGSLILGIGLSYTYLLRIPIEKLVPYVAVGIVSWGYMASSISEGGESFVSSATILRQSSLPLPIFILRTMIRNIINLAHQLLIVVGVLFWFRIFPGIGILWSLIGLVSVTVNLGWLATLVALISARFRDIPQIVSSVLQFVFFISPIFWVVPPALEHSPFVIANPFFLGIQAIRSPLLDGGRFPALELALLGAIGLFGWIFALVVYTVTRRRVVHYL